MADVVDVVPVLLGKIHDQLVELNVRNERLDTGQQRQTEVLVKLEAGQRLHTEQLAELNRRVERLDRRTEHLEEGQRELVDGQKELNGRVGRLEEGQRELNGRVGRLDEGQQELIGRVGRVEGQLGELVRIVSGEVVTRLVDLERRMVVVEDTVGIGER
jgi:predicted nuclease with TOPRIM domain